MSSSGDPSLPAGSHRLLIATLMMLAGISPLVGSLGAPLVPQIADLFEVSLSAAQWSLTGPLLLGAVSAPLIGRLGEGPWRRPVVIVTLLVVLAGTVLAALPLGFGAFLAGRAAQGAGFGLLPMAMAIARDVLPADRRNATIASISVAATVAAGVGFPVSTAIASFGGVRGAYVFGIVAVTAIVVLAARTVTSQPGTRRPVDVVEAFLLGAGSTGVLVAVTQGNTWSWSSPGVWGCGAGGVLLLLVWGWRSLGSSAPMVDLRIARTRPVLATHLTAVLVGASMYAVLAFATIVVQADKADGGLGLDVFVSGLLMLPYSLAGWCGAIVARRSGWSPERILPVGCAWFALATLLLAVSADSVIGVALAMAAAGFGGGCAFAALPVVVVGHVPVGAAASALSANHVVRAFGFAIGSAGSVVLIEIFSPDTGGVSAEGVGTAALVTTACGVAGVVVALLMLRPSLHVEKKFLLQKPLKKGTS